MKKFVSWLLVFAMVLGFGEAFATSAAAETVITKFDISGVVAPVVGQLPSTEGIVCDTPGVTVTATWYYYDYTVQGYVGKRDAFTADQVYNLNLDVDAQEGYCFDSNAMASYTVNGQAPDSAVYCWATRLDVDMVYIPESTVVLEQVIVQALPELAVGTTMNEELYKNGIVLPENAGYTVKSASLTDEEWNDVDGPLEKKQYSSYFELVPKEGYIFHPSDAEVVLPEGLQYQIIVRSNYVDVYLYPDLRDVTHQASLTLPAYEPGDALDLQGVTVTGGTLDPEYSEWTDSGYNPVTGVLEDGKRYYLRCVIDPAEGWKYDPESTVVTVTGDPDPSIYVYEDSITVYCEVDLRKVALGSIDVTDLPGQIKPGAAPAVEPQVEYDRAEVTGARWTDVSGQTVTEFVEGKVYFLELTLKPGSGYVFAEDLDVYCDAQEVSVSAQADTATVLLRYSLLSKVEKVALTVTGLEKGAPVADVKVTVPEGANYTVAGIKIFDMAANDYVTGGTFADKSNYELIYYLEPAEGWEFADWPQVSVNGEPTDQYWVDQGQLQIYEVFTTCDPIDKVAVTVSEPQVGGNVADAVATVPADAPYTVSWDWYDETAEEYVEDGVFQDVHKYRLELYLSAAEGYYFVEDAVLTVNGEVQAADDASFYGDSGACWKTYSFMTQIDTVALPAFPTDIKVGDTVVPEVAAPEGADYTVAAFWGNLKSDTDNPVEAGNCYCLIYRVSANPGCEFADDVTVTVGGEECSVLWSGASFMVMKVYNFGVEEIRRIDLTVEEPEIGARVSEFQVAGEAPGYDLMSDQWFVNKTGNVDDDMDSPMVFLEGYYHYAMVVLGVQEDAVFADDLSVYVNGRYMQVLDSFNVGTMTYLIIGFGKLTEVAPGDLDADGAVNVDDAIYLLQHVLMPELFPVEQDADFDGNGSVNVDDAIYLLQHVLMPDLFPLVSPNPSDVMTHAQYMAAPMDSQVTVECYVQATQSWWEDTVIVYAQDRDGGYYLYNMACSEADAARLTPGTKIRVTGYKGDWAGLVEIQEATFEFVEGADSFVAEPLDVTALLGTQELIEHQNEKALVKGATVVACNEQGDGFRYGWDGSKDVGSDVYFKVSVNGKEYDFCVEQYLTEDGTAAYDTAETLQVGDVIDIQCFLYWYEGPQPHVTAITKVG